MPEVPEGFVSVLEAFLFGSSSQGIHPGDATVHKDVLAHVWDSVCLKHPEMWVVGNNFLVR
jgi:hypothetical protein